MAKKRAAKRKSEVQVKEKIEENHTKQIENGDTPAKTPKKKKSSVKLELQNNMPASASKSTNKSKAEDEDNADYEVEKIIDVNYKSNNKREFLIRWKNYSAKHDTWEPEENLSCDELISKFLEVKEKLAKTPRKELRDKPKSTSRFVSPVKGRKSKRTAGTRKTYVEDEDGNDD